MENFEFVSPTHFVFGKGAEEQVGSKLAERGARTVLLHFGGQSAVKSGLIDRVKASLDAQGIKHVELGGVRPNPEITLAREGIALCKEHDVDWVLAVGGGRPLSSSMDALRQMEAQRRPLYLAAADAVIPNNGTLDDALHAAMEALDEIFDS